MRSRHSSPSASRSSTDRARASRATLRAAWLLAALAACACGDDGGDGDGGADAGPDASGEVCGPGDAPADGITVELAGDLEGVVFGQLRSSANNDCPPPETGAPTSITIQGAQTDPADPETFLTLCLPRPDRIESEPIPLVDDDMLDEDTRVQLIDLVAAPADGCSLAIDGEREPGGQVTFSGFCDDGVDEAGYALAFAATVPLLRTCGGDPPEQVDAELSGEVAVSAGSL
jgi:hypothetical protein